MFIKMLVVSCNTTTEEVEEDDKDTFMMYTFSDLSKLVCTC